MSGQRFSLPASARRAQTSPMRPAWCHPLPSNPNLPHMLPRWVLFFELLCITCGGLVASGTLVGRLARPIPFAVLMRDFCRRYGGSNRKYGGLSLPHTDLASPTDRCVPLCRGRGPAGLGALGQLPTVCNPYSMNPLSSTQIPRGGVWHDGSKQMLAGAGACPWGGGCCGGVGDGSGEGLWEHLSTLLVHQRPFTMPLPLTCTGARSPCPRLPGPLLPRPRPRAGYRFQSTFLCVLHVHQQAQAAALRAPSCPSLASTRPHAGYRFESTFLSFMCINTGLMVVMAPRSVTEVHRFAFVYER